MLEERLFMLTLLSALVRCVSEWTKWNSVRTLAAVGAVALLTLALVRRVELDAVYSPR